LNCELNVIPLFIMGNKDNNRISVEQFALTQRNRRGQPMSASYVYRLIRRDMKGIEGKPLWFKYELEGEKDRIWIIEQPACSTWKQPLP
jgi:hypothetical protein